MSVSCLLGSPALNVPVADKPMAQTDLCLKSEGHWYFMACWIIVTIQLLVPHIIKCVIRYIVNKIIL